MEPIEHLGVIVHTDEWRPGATCDECREALEARRAVLAGGQKHVNFNLRRLRVQNAAHVTSREIAREITDSAKAEGRDLARPSDYATQHWNARQ